MDYHNLTGQENMSTQNITPAPFQDNTKSEQDREAFSIHTMHDDLESLQKIKNPILEKTTELPLNSSSEPINMVEKSPMVNEFVPKQQFNNMTEQQTPVVKTEIFETEKSKSETPFSPPFLEKKVTPVEIPTGVDTKKIIDSSATTYRLVMFFIVALTVSIVGLGGYYFWIIQAPSEQIEKPVAIIEEEVLKEIIPVETEPEPIVIAPEEKYSQSKPNYLVLDLATISTEDIKKKIIEVALDLKENAKPSPYEFVVVDANNNPITFSIFAAATKINFSSSLLSALDKNFTLFIYNDGDNARLGLSITVLKKDDVIKELLKQEKTLVADSSFLFLNSVAEIKSGVFNTTTFMDSTIHYLNVNQKKDLSIDYALANSQLIIGTSKNIQELLIEKTLISEPVTVSKKEVETITPSQN